MGDEVTEKIEKEVEELQDILKKQLKDQEDLMELEENLKSDAFVLEKTVGEHRKTSAETKMRMFWENFKYTLIIGVVILLAVFIVCRLFLL